MIENEVLVTTRYGRQPAFLACPEEPGRFPPIILYMDAPGMREELRHMARRIANHGYCCLVPDLYYRLGTVRFDVPRRNDAMSAVIRAAMLSLTNAAVAEDTAGMIAFLDAQDKVKPGPLGCVGHCMSGSFALTVAARFPRMIATAALYGVNMVTEQPDSPHRVVDRIKGEVYIGFAEIDPGVPPNVVPELQSALEKARTKHRLETFAGVHHGFCFSARPDYDPVAAEASWVRLFDLWDRNLK
jgi:carboxymethylenebutenolidase